MPSQTSFRARNVVAPVTRICEALVHCLAVDWEASRVLSGGGHGRGRRGPERGDMDLGVQAPSTRR